MLICTVFFGVLVGYALAVLEWRGRSATFALALLVQVVPFQLLIVPLYVLIARNYGLADNYLGMILPFAINSTAVIIFRQYFLQLPKELFEAARIDGASEFGLLTRVALPLVRPALVTVILLTFIGPWNEFLWPFLITKRADLQPLAVSLANYISNVAATRGQPVRGDPGRRGGARRSGGDLVHRVPAVLRLQRSGVRGEGLTDRSSSQPSRPTHRRSYMP